jgi:acyl transferase domain-containing protein
MGKQLFCKSSVFRQSILEMDEDFQKITGYSLVRDVGLFGDLSNSTVHDLSNIWPIAIILPALTILQCALFDLLSSIGVRPDIVVGDSAGEIPLLYASGAASRSMTVELAIVRGIAATIAESVGGTMAALACSISEAQAIIDETLEDNKNHVEIACHNAPDAVTIAGLEPFVDEVVAVAKARGFLASKLRTRVPFHSSLMDSCKKEYQVAVEALWSKYPGDYTSRIPTYSTVTGELMCGPFTPEYSWNGARNPVLFTEAISSLRSEHPTATFVEMSPHPVLSSYLSSLGGTTILCLLRRPKRSELVSSELALFLDALGRLAIAGHTCVDFMRLNGVTEVPPTFSPAKYPFSPKHVPFHAESYSFQKRLQPRFGPLNHPRLRVNSKTHPVIAEHVIKGEPIMPAAGYLESVRDEYGSLYVLFMTCCLGIGVWSKDGVGCGIPLHAFLVGGSTSDCRSVP